MAIPQLPWLASWLGNPTWQDATWVIKGMQAHLWLVASQRQPPGVIPADDKWLRRQLRLPTPLAVARATKDLVALSSDLLKSSSLPLSRLSSGLARQIARSPLDWQLAHSLLLEFSLLGVPVSAELRDAQQTVWQDHLWVHHWKPQLLADWLPVDAAMVQAYPALASSKLDAPSLFHPLPASLALSTTQAPSPPSQAVQAPAKPRRPAKGKGSHPVPPPSGWLLAKSGCLALPLTPAFPLSALLHLKPSRLTSVLAPSMAQPDRARLWEIGLLYFTSDGHSEKQAGSLLGKLIKIHGEPTVMVALQTMLGRHVPPSDSFRFIQAVLKQIQRGEVSPASLKAQNQRAHVAI